MLNAMPSASHAAQLAAQTGAAPASSAQSLAAAATHPDLPGHLLDLANQDQLVPFLQQTQDAVQLAGDSPFFAEQLNPVLKDVRVALDTLPPHRLSRDEAAAVDATKQALDAHLGTIEPDPQPTGEVPGGGLEAHERAGSHVIEKHVGKTEQQLLDRLKREKISGSSSFRDLPAAEHFIAQTIANHQAQIDAWVDGQGGNRLVLSDRFDSSTGISIKKGDTQAEDVYSVKIVLERSDKLGIGYRLVTGYPTAP